MIAATQVNDLIGKVCLNDDSHAYKELFILYHARLTQFSCTIIGNRESAEETVSDVFLKMWLNRKSLRKIENFHLYLYVSTKNLSINRLQKQKREQWLSLDEMTVEFKSIYFDPEQLMITGEMFKRLRAAIHQLPPRCQLVFKLIREDGLAYKEVAELLHLSVKTIENQMTIALRRISKSIQFDIKKTISF